ncbi:TolC family protein [Sphingomonas sp. PB2P19]|uniref:TolC family protein n=1 Tax=Sphingomonas rhamnosi TaxID=3096156 RepID=UPI002FC767BA
MTYLSHTASFHSNERIAPSNREIKQIASRDQLELGVSAVRAANSALEGVRRGFAEGFRSNFEVFDSEQRLLNAQILVANARYSRYSS